MCTHRKAKVKMASVLGMWLLALTGGAVPSFARAAGLEDAINAVTKPTVNQRAYFAVIDVQTARSADVVADAVLGAVKRYSSGAEVNLKIPPAVSPAAPDRMRFATRGGRQSPQCDGDVANIAALDVSMAKYGEGTFSVACVFPYRGGYQVNYFASFSQRTGGMDATILGAMLGRLVTNAFGIGDSSVFVGKTIEAMKEKLAEVGAKGALVELYPAIQGLEVESTGIRPSPPTSTPELPPSPDAARPSVLATPRQATELQVPRSLDSAPASGVPLGPAPDGMAEVARVMTKVQRKLDESRASMAAHVAASGATPSALQARKELTAMGLSYFDAGQFVAAIRRGDLLAVRLYLAGQGVDVRRPGPDGLTPLQVAEESGQEAEVAAAVRLAVSR